MIKQIRCTNCNEVVAQYESGYLKGIFYALCPACKDKWKAAHDMAEQALRNVPEFAKGLFK